MLVYVCIKPNQTQYRILFIASLTLLLLGVVLLTACQVSDEALAGQATRPTATAVKSACDRDNTCKAEATACIQQNGCNALRGGAKTTCINSCYQQAVDHNNNRICVQTGQEVCDRIDNNCNNRVDDIPASSFCNTGLAGSCARGSLVCVNGPGLAVAECRPPSAAEICDEQDNDCNGQIDEGVLNACGQCGPVPQEICDSQDNDCNGQVDEMFNVQTDINNCGACGNVCPAGNSCENGGCVAPAVAPAVEVCGWANWQVCSGRGQSGPYCSQSDRCCGGGPIAAEDRLVNEGCDGSVYYNESRTNACGVIRFEEDCSQDGRVCQIGLQHQHQGCVGEVGVRCDGNSECISGICGENEARQSVCEEPNQPAGSACAQQRHSECASGLCGRNEARQFVCEEPNQVLGSVCEANYDGNNRECASGLCGRNEAGQLVCEEPNQPAGSACNYGTRNECASGRCLPHGERCA